MAKKGTEYLKHSRKRIPEETEKAIFKDIVALVPYNKIMKDYDLSSKSIISRIAKKYRRDLNVRIPKKKTKVTKRKIKKTAQTIAIIKQADNTTANLLNAGRNLTELYETTMKILNESEAEAESIEKKLNGLVKVAKEKMGNEVNAEWKKLFLQALAAVTDFHQNKIIMLRAVKEARETQLVFVQRLDKVLGLAEVHELIKVFFETFNEVLDDKT